MIQSILDNDLYKLTMQNAVIKLFPNAKVRYQFINRGNTQFPDGFGEELRKEIVKMAEIGLTDDEKQYLIKNCYYLPPTYTDFLKGYRFDPSEVGIIQNDGDLQVSIEGLWYRTILWEVPLMAAISELYFKMTNAETRKVSEIEETMRSKAKFFNMKGVKVADFGTRRRFSFENHDRLVRELSTYGTASFIGTSNVYLAKKYDVKPIGTHAHEWFMFMSAKYGFKMSNRMALEHWVDVYRGDLGIALSDTLTTDVFFHSFDTKFAKLFDGVRQDSGDPIAFVDKTFNHYTRLRIDPKTKTIVFSDSLNPEKVEEIADYCLDKFRASFGIGTNLTNDVGVKPLNIVIKITAAKPYSEDDWIPTVKLSDTKGKYTGNEETIDLCKRVLRID